MRTKPILPLFLLATMLVVPITCAKPAGYNYDARVFVGTGEMWAMQKFGWTHEQAHDYLGLYAHDKLVMKWNAEWDRGNAENWNNPPYNAYETNEWNGAFPGGSGEIWHYKIKWVGGSHIDGEPSLDGGYYIWGQFEVLLDHGTVKGDAHDFLAHALPNGFGIPP